MKKFFLSLVFILNFSSSFFAEEGIDINQSSAPKLEMATTSYETAFIKMIVVLIGLIALALLAFYLFKKISSSNMVQSNHYKNIKILEKRALSPKSILYLIEVGGKKLLIGESQVELRGISELSWIENEKKGL